MTTDPSNLPRRPMFAARKHSKPPIVGSKKLPSRTWAETLVMVKRNVNGQAWRTAALSAHPRWREFAAAWLIVADGIAGPIAGEPFEVDGLAADDQLALMWDGLGSLLDGALDAVVARTAMGEAQVAAIFEGLQGAGLVFPDGTLHDRAVALLNSREMVRYAGELHKQFSAVTGMQLAEQRMRKVVADAAALAAATAPAVPATP